MRHGAKEFRARIWGSGARRSRRFRIRLANTVQKSTGLPTLKRAEPRSSAIKKRICLLLFYHHAD
jgi:hypothetical protein